MSMLDQFVNRIIEARVLTDKDLPADATPKSVLDKGICQGRN